MGAMGRYIDGLDDESRDRLIQAVGFRSCELRPKQGEACLVGTAEPACPEAADEDGGGSGWPAGKDRRAAAESFDASFRRARRRPRRFDNRSRLIRAIKARASEGHAPLLPAAVPQSQAVNV